jgi:DNA-directed RNA polymerase specialized sigma24 family protein
MTETFTWFRALDGHPHLTRAVWLTAACGMGIRRAAHILGIHRDTVRARRDEALDRMAEGVGRGAA